MTVLLAGNKEEVLVNNTTPVVNQFIKTSWEYAPSKAEAISRDVKVRLFTNKDGDWRIELLEEWAMKCLATGT